MAEYIEREALLNKIDSLQFTVRGIRLGKSILSEYIEYYKNSILRIIGEQPAADVEEVRCKDCKYWQDNNGGYPHPECRWGHDETPDADDFCSYGERKDDKHEN